MKIAHTLKFFPKTSGLYETARELISEEVKQGYDAKFLDTRSESTFSKYLYDRGIRSCNLDWFLEADIVVIHQMLPEKLMARITKPIVVVLHGTPEACYMSDLWENSFSFKLVMRLASDPRITFVTLWERHFHFWNNIAPGKVVYIPSCVDFETFDPEKITPYQFSGLSAGFPNILFADTWRIIKDPFHVINAFKLFKQWHDKARLHIYCRPNEDNNPARKFFDEYLVKISEGKDNFFGVYNGYTLEIDRVMRGVDLIVTQQMDETRIVREARALGTPVVQPDSTYDYYHPLNFAEKMARTWEQILRGEPEFSRSVVREKAKLEFNPAVTVSRLTDHFKHRLSLV